ncbi:MAG: hypothetical protein ACK56F_28425, partial [bacterium]
MKTCPSSSSGRVSLSEPRGAFPTAERTAETITTSRMVILLWFRSVAERLALLEHVLDAGHRLGVAAQREEGLPLQIEDVLLGARRAERDVAARHDPGQLLAHDRVVARDEPAHPHLVEEELDGGAAGGARQLEAALARRLVAGHHEAE